MLFRSRTWTYVAQRKGWVDDESHWRGATRAVEDRLSDALHGALTQRFVDRRTSVLLRRLKQKESLVAEVNDKGEVTVEGQFVGRLEGFRFRQDASASPDEAKTLRQAAVQSLAPQFHLRSDRFYNSPDTEMDLTEQGGLMWGDQAIGKLVAGSDPLKPVAHAFVDDEAGPEVAQKVQRRLQHFIDRRIATQFEPLTALSRDETLTGLARGFAFRMIEGFGILSRDGIAAEVKQLDQEARGALRKHGVRFGQFTIFLPLLLKPAPTRLRLVLWSLSKDLGEFPESPPPGLVTIPVDQQAPEGTYLMSGYRPAGERAIRIDMLERLADMLRGLDSRGGFEATPDMLSITGMTLDQFSSLMSGLGYKAEKGERAKARAAAKPAEQESAGASSVKAVDGGGSVDTLEAHPGAEGASEVAATPDATDGPQANPGALGTSEVEAGPGRPEEIPSNPPADVPDPDPVETPPSPPSERPGEAPDEGPAPGPTEIPDTPDPDTTPEMEVFYTFTWAGNRQRREGSGKPRGQRAQGKPAGRGKEGGDKGRQRQERGAGGGGKPAKFQSRPPRKEKQIDPDNPFAAALAGFNDKS